MKQLLLSSMLCAIFFPGTLMASAIIQSTHADGGTIKSYEHKGTSVDVSSDVPERFLGTFDAPESRLRPEYNPDSTWRQFARKIRLNRDGTGYIHMYGRDQPRMNFEWGFAVENDRLMVGQYSYKDKSYPKVHTVIFNSSDGGYGYRYVYEHENQVAIMPFGVPVRVPMLKP